MRLTVAVVGCGHMGAHHARVVARDPRCRLVALVDVVPGRAEALAARWGGEARRDVPDVDAVIVATPTTTHGEVAGRLAREGRWVLVEKPLAASPEEAAALDLPNVAVGHVERFNPAVRATGPVAPRFLVARRHTPFTGRSTDIDVVLDLVVHDLDHVHRWGGDVVELSATGAGLRTRLDIASVRLVTERGLVAWLYASRVADRPERSMHLMAADGWRHLDLLAGRATWRGHPLAASADDGLTVQWDRFVRWTRGDGLPPTSAREATRSVGLADRIRCEIGADRVAAAK